MNPKFTKIPLEYSKQCETPKFPQFFQNHLLILKFTKIITQPQNKNTILTLKITKSHDLSKFCQNYKTSMSSGSKCTKEAILYRT